MESIQLKGPVTITKTRWDVRIESADGQVLIASADSYLTGSDSIWFGSQEEYNEAVL